MRKIKFRGKVEYPQKYFGKNDIPNGKFIVGELHLNCRFPHIHTDKINKYPINPNTIGQFTGLHDKNGKEIYEGDIMGLPENDANGVKYKNRYVRVVEWVNDGFFLLDYCPMGDEVRKYGDRLALEISLKSNYDGIARCFHKRGLDYTVIGNIHDNPELLKQK